MLSLFLYERIVISEMEAVTLKYFMDSSLVGV